MAAMLTCIMSMCGSSVPLRPAAYRAVGGEVGRCAVEERTFATGEIENIGGMLLIVSPAHAFRARVVRPSDRATEIF